MAKPVGMLLYVDFTTNTTYSVAGCLYNVSGFGIDAGEEDLDICLSATAGVKTPGDPRYTPITATLEYVAGSTGISSTLFSAAKNRTLGNIGLKIPTDDSTVFYYATMAAYCSQHVMADPQRTQEMKANVVFLPQADPTWSTTAPSTA